MKAPSDSANVRLMTASEVPSGGAVVHLKICKSQGRGDESRQIGGSLPKLPSLRKRRERERDGPCAVRADKGFFFSFTGCIFGRKGADCDEPVRWLGSHAPPRAGDHQRPSTHLL